MPSTTCDLYDRFEEVARVSLAGFRQFGRCRAFHGFAVTVKCYEDNSRVRELCNSPGRGRVLVVDGGGSLRCALVGDQIAKAAIENGWSGLIVNGCIRDSAEIEELEIGIHALGTVPRKSRRREQRLATGRPGICRSGRGVAARRPCRRQFEGIGVKFTQ
jgi:regulator of ribonuclease activity A